MDFRQDGLLSDCKRFVQDFNAAVSSDEWVSWTAYMAGQPLDLQRLVCTALERDCLQLRQSL